MESKLIQNGSGDVMKVYAVWGRNSVDSEMFGLFMKKERAEQEARRLRGVYDKYDSEGVVPKEDRGAISYSEYLVDEMEVQE